MANQSPMISIPRKSTDDVDWTSPIRTLISQSYGENPENYAAECASLHRCRQDAVRGAGSDSTARDLLYKYFGQLELIELRFSEIRVTFPWRDAFTGKLTTQTSIAFEKASILYQIASVHSAIASSQSRADAEGLKRAFYYFRTSAGMLGYINDNFLHAPSTDLSREVVRFLVGIILAQATEVFFEKCVEEKKGSALVAKIGAQAAAMYTGLGEQVKEFMGKGVFDRNWVTLIQIKSKYFTSLSNYHRGLAESSLSKHGDALVRYTLACTHAKEAQRLASSFSSSFNPTLSPTLPPDAGTSLTERLKAHLSLCTDRQSNAQRENDLIYHAVLPNADSLPPIETLVVATAIPIQEVYGTPEVQKTIGQDIFLRLVPLSVHESASVYSEEKAKLVRGEVEKAELAGIEAQSALDAMGIKDGLRRFRNIAQGNDSEDIIPPEVHRWITDISLLESREPTSTLLSHLNTKKSTVQSTLSSISQSLELESRECESLRVQFSHKWSQEPSAGPTKSFRQELKSHYGALEAAQGSDAQVNALWDIVRPDVGVLIGSGVEEVFSKATDTTQGSLLDLDNGEDDDREKERIAETVQQIDERLARQRQIEREKNEVLKDLKEKIISDDVSHLLLLNRRNANSPNSGVEPALFAAELEKFRPFQVRLAATIQLQENVLKEVEALWKGLQGQGRAGRGTGKGGAAEKYSEREKRKQDAVERFKRAKEGYMEVRDGIAKGLNFYTELASLTATLARNVDSYVKERKEEREGLVRNLEVERRLSGGPPGLGSSGGAPPLPPPPHDLGLASGMSSMHLGHAPSSHSVSAEHPVLPPPPSRNSVSSMSYLPPPPPPQQQSSYQQQTQSPSPYQHQPSPSYGINPPPPPPAQAPLVDPYASLGGLFNPGSTTSPPPPPVPQQQQQHQRQSSYSLSSYGGSPAPAPSAPQQPQPQRQQTGYQSYQGPGQNQSYQSPPHSMYGSPPPPPPQQLQQQQHWSPPPPLQQQQQGGYQGFPPPPSQQQGGYQGFPPPPPPAQQNYGYGGGAGYGR
ncbi:BRO1-domain-containing protein [Gymnopus androsaceus JB14]|uniref:BRO domain-containing protein 1 n=1 Tax=Gymnopus androsaceus JB14 TaxID=1447944 RepID=A0A6A4IKG0_9AGAR|nr:BRO1-domain-containing protein [Gymnopus androsaceus JB14]